MAALKSEVLRVLFVTPECAPLAKVGGLADVSAALPAALCQAGVDIRVLLPGYSGVLARADHKRPLAEALSRGTASAPRLLEGRLASGVPLMIVDQPAAYARSGGPYQNEAGEDWPDNAMRFGLLSRVAALLASSASPLSWRPHVVHLHDWPAALAAAYLRYGDGARAASLVTVHNLAFQGNYDRGTLAALDLPPQSFAPDGLEFHGRLSFLKAGLFYADGITTVSPTYAREIQTEARGAGMHGLLQQRRGALHGIVNGIDTREWNPETDAHLPLHYSRDALHNKGRIKRALREQLKLATASDDDLPLLGIVGRLTHQKGADLLIAAAAELASFAQLVVLGAGQREHEEALRALAARHPGRIAVTIGFDEALAHWIEAGADLFLMPSRFEPCGLNQMYSQRYGTPPVAHATGGLVDTIVDCTSAALDAGTATGFLFREATAAALCSAVRRAVAAYRRPDTWRMLQQNGMSQDFSWTASARQYAAVYRQLAAGRDST